MGRSPFAMRSSGSRLHTERYGSSSMAGLSPDESGARFRMGFNSLIKAMLIAIRNGDADFAYRHARLAWAYAPGALRHMRASRLKNMKRIVQR
jgi:hypothetical protein